METSTKQSPLHSGILDSNYRKELLGLFFDESGSKAIADRLDELDGLVSLKHQIPDWQMDVINHFTSIKSIKEALFKGLETVFTIEDAKNDDYQEFVEMIFGFMKDVLNFYEDQGQQYQLSELLSERDYLRLWGNFFRVLYKNGGIYSLEQGEVSSRSSAFRKNSDRKSTESRQSGGRKIDGIFSCVKANKLELGAIEGGKKNEASYGTKFITDSLKVAKVLKDMFDLACNEAGLSGSDVNVAREGMETYGFLASGSRIEFVTLRHFGGRFLYFNRGYSASLPLNSDDETLMRIKRILIYFLQRRGQMADGGKFLGKLINISSLEQQKYESFPTLTTPPNSPKSKKVGYLYL
ncbi:hypothetical protein BGZ46_008319 [Entomortierella lignicola]|nr:hypothetical protein BGZ46_008319 [Entomortierella lignicola]